uniref:Uncharacterized protein n=1 Tax=Nelumbo nucifera TaxID=4432 RepID=A0A822Y152_NELNU|nr:TPA_asm: hypothetical protein HUJ06_026259 [Nelumbo nucifera]
MAQVSKSGFRSETCCKNTTGGQVEKGGLGAVFMPIFLLQIAAMVWVMVDGFGIRAGFQLLDGSRMMVSGLVFCSKM